MLPDDDEEPLIPEPLTPEQAGAGAATPDAGDGGARKFVAETVRKAVLTGLGAVFLTEENARKIARDWKLPKDIVSYVSTQATGAKDEIVRVVTEEVRKFFESEALRREFLRVLSSMSIEVRAEISLKPARGGKKVDFEVKSAQVRPRVRRPRAEEPAPPPPEAPPEGEEGG